MNKIILTLSLLVLICLSVISFAQETTDSTVETTPNNVRLLVHKSVSPNVAVVEGNITFTITLINVGDEPAYDLDVKDNEWPEGSFDVVEGDIKSTFEKLSPNERATLKYTIVSKSKGEISTQSAFVTYRLAPSSGDKDATQGLKYSAKSNVLPPIPILTQADYDRRNDSHFGDWAIFLVLTLLPVGLPYVAYLYSNNQIQELAEQKKKRRDVSEQQSEQ
ncbi:hypothetical protein ABK040_000190 [Willaertia magna]